MKNTSSDAAGPLTTTTPQGLHDFLLGEVLPKHVRSVGNAVDLGAGTGLLASRLLQMGWNVRAADLNVTGFRADLPFTQVDFNKPDFASQLGECQYDLVISVEVIEHVENPIGFLRNIGRLLKPGGLPC